MKVDILRNKKGIEANCKLINKMSQIDARVKEFLV